MRSPLLTPLFIYFVCGLTSWAYAGERPPARPTRPVVAGKAELKITGGGPGLIALDKDPNSNKYLPKMSAFVCPNCGLRFISPEHRSKINGSRIDRDLCPHPIGNTEKYSDLVMCPKCGLSGDKRIYDKKLPLEIQEWINNTLTPRTQAELRKLFTIKIEVPDSELYTFFSTKYSGRDMPSDHYLPETIRTENALKLLEFLHATPAALAHVERLTAWAHRRNVNKPLMGPDFGPSIHRITLHLSKDLPADPTPEAHEAAATKYLESDPPPPLLERQLLLFFIAGDLQRMGNTRQAQHALQQVILTTRDDAQWNISSGNEQTNKAIQVIRAALASEAQERLQSINREIVLLSNAAEHIRRALAIDAYDADTIPAQIYLIGECERRAMHFGRAYTWLEAAEHFRLPPEKQGAEIWASTQRTYLREYLATEGFKRVPDNPQRNADKELLLRLMTQFKQAFPPAPSPTPAEKPLMRPK